MNPLRSLWSEGAAIVQGVFVLPSFTLRYLVNGGILPLTFLTSARKRNKEINSLVGLSYSMPRQYQALYLTLPYLTLPYDISTLGILPTLPKALTLLDV